jgi:hypothetical protein
MGRKHAAGRTSQPFGSHCIFDTPLLSCDGKNSFGLADSAKIDRFRKL